MMPLCPHDQQSAAFKDLTVWHRFCVGGLISKPFSPIAMTPVEKPAFRCLPATDAATLIRAEPKAIIFDVRDMASYQRAHIDGAAHLSEDRLVAWMRRLPKDALIMIYCFQGNASRTFAQMFVDFRYSRVFSVDGGYEPLAAAMACTVTV